VTVAIGVGSTACAALVLPRIKPALRSVAVMIFFVFNWNLPASAKQMRSTNKDSGLSL
jgi:hypothetical protein